MAVCALEDETKDVKEPLSFQVTFDFHDFVRDHMLVEDTLEGNGIIQKSAHVVGQENDGSLLISWDALSDDGGVATHIGMYNPSSPSYRSLFTHDGQVNVTEASVDHNKSLLAFTICERYSTGTNYDSMVAEINPCNRVFSLNLCSGDFRKLQFIQSPSTGSASSHWKTSKSVKSNLLVIIPNNWICLYTFKLEPMHKGYSVVSQPHQEIIVENISWYQWDPKRQWLCYARLGNTPTPTKRMGKKKLTESSIIMIILTFEGAERKVLVTMALPIPYDVTLYLNASNYFNCPLAFCYPVYELNMKLLHNAEGVWCICLQHRTPSPETKLEYSVYILHNSHVIDSEVYLTSPPINPNGYYINFMLLGNFVIAYIPEVMLHILNLSIHTDSCHHIILKDSPSLPYVGDSTGQQERILLTAVASKYLGDIDTPVFDTETHMFYSCRLEPEGLFNIFKNITDLDLRLSLLHVMIADIQQYSTALQMIECVCQSPLSPDDPRLFQEFILALSFTNVLSECTQLFAKYLPLTLSRLFSGNIYKNSDGSKYALLRCTELPNFFKQLLVQSDQKLVSASNDYLFNYSNTNSDAFDYLCFNGVINQPHILNKRISLNEISEQINLLSVKGATTGNGSNKKHNSKNDKNEAKKGSKFVDKLKVLMQSSKSGSRVELNGGATNTLPFLLVDEDLESTLELRSNLLRDRILFKMATELGLSSRSATGSMALMCEKYWVELHRSSRILLQVIWKSMKFTNENHPLQSSIHHQPAMEEMILFELLESFYMSHMDLGITPPAGFATLFICIGYMCLEPSVFIQYLRNNVFMPTQQFLELLFLECEEVEETYLFEIVSNLSYELQQVAFSLWKHPLLVEKTHSN
jgi:hypothetical protein